MLACVLFCCGNPCRIRHVTRWLLLTKQKQKQEWHEYVIHSYNVECCERFFQGKFGKILMLNFRFHGNFNGYFFHNKVAETITKLVFNDSTKHTCFLKCSFQLASDYMSTHLAPHADSNNLPCMNIGDEVPKSSQDVINKLTVQVNHPAL